MVMKLESREAPAGTMRGERTQQAARGEPARRGGARRA